MRRFTCATAAMTVLAALAASPAQAAPVTIGSPLSGPFAQALIGTDLTLANTTLEAGTATAPVSGAIVRWRVGGVEGGPLRLRVLRPAGTPAFAAVASSGPETPAAPEVQTYATVLPVQAGDTIGLDLAAGTFVGARVVDPGFGFSAWVPPLAEAEPRAPTVALNPLEIAFNADLVPAPTIAALTPARGSFEGGGAVTIAGADLSGASAVRFGATPASSFSLTGDGTIAAVAPAGAPGPAIVSVTTIAGTTAASPAATYVYAACRVPRLTGKRLKAVRRTMRRARDCRLGRVRKVNGATARSGRVVRQGRGAGKLLPPGSRVSVTLGR